ncbi:MAG: hypothetical protein Q7J35_13650 [Candidatus Methanoperedens sp.]|nr:hypothetical protein [Candidatus Methanoperedens sp.]
MSCPDAGKRAGLFYCLTPEGRKVTEKIVKETLEQKPLYNIH